MTARAAALCLPLLLAACRPAAPHPLRTGYYVWHYDWTPAVDEAVQEAAREPDVTFLVMAGAVGQAAQPHPDWPALAAAGRPSVPVLRVFAPAVSWLEKDPVRLQQVVCDQFARVREARAAAALPSDALQLDLDVPERLLADYARFLRALRPALPGLTLTVTALPSHLDHRAFAAVARACDGYTLQVHGLDYPQRLGDAAAILNPRVARTAVDRAQRLGVPFDVALPTYAHELVFDRVRGAFRGLVQPADPAPDLAQVVVRIAATDPQAVQAVLRQAAVIPNCRGVNWFRLPVRGDRLAWDAESLQSLRAGRAVEPRVQAGVMPADQGRWLLVVTNHAALTSRYIGVSLRWPQAQGDFGLRGARLVSDALPGLLPERLLAPVPAPGCALTAAWFRAAAPPVVDDSLMETARPRAVSSLSRSAQ